MPKITDTDAVIDHLRHLAALVGDGRATLQDVDSLAHGLLDLDGQLSLGVAALPAQWAAVALPLPAELRGAVERVRASGVTACENDDRGVIADAVVAAVDPDDAAADAARADADVDYIRGG